MKLDIDKGKKIAGPLYNAFATNGLFGSKTSPEDFIPAGMKCGSPEHILFLTLTVSIDYQRSADALWKNAARTYDDIETRYLFSPAALHDASYQIVRKDLQKYKLSKKPNQDARIWRTIGVTFHKQWNGDPLNFLEACDWDAVAVLKRLKESTHVWKGRQHVDYPWLRGDKIGPLWVRMLWDNARVSELQNIECVPIPVDVHVARATLALGVVRGEFDGDLNELFDSIRMAWFESVSDTEVAGRGMIALDVDEPLWHLSKDGCSKRDPETGACPVFDKCEAAQWCVRGRIKNLTSHIELDT